MISAVLMLGDELIEKLELVDASKLAATCREFRGIHLPLIVKDGSKGFRCLRSKSPVASQELAVDSRSVDASGDEA